MAKDATEIRLKLLANGYAPTLNHGKRPVLAGWQGLKVTAAMIRRWDRSKHQSTGARIEGGLVAIDCDVAMPDRPDLIDALAERARVILPGIFERGLVRYSTGVKEAWFVRVDGAPFGHIMSRLWVRPEDADKEPGSGVTSARIEVFGGDTSRQFGQFGPHGYDDAGNVVSEYSWDGPSPATVPLADLPAYPMAAFGLVCQAFDEICEAAGLVPMAPARGAGGAAYIFSLEADTAVDLEDGGRATVAELELIAPTLGGDYMRCSGTFHDKTRVRRDSHSISIGRHGIGIYDFQESVTYCRRDAEPKATASPLSDEEVAALNALRDHADDTASVPPTGEPTPERRAIPLEFVEIDDDVEMTYARALVWLHMEMAYCAKAIKTAPGAFSIYPGGEHHEEPIAIPALRGDLMPWSYMTPPGPRGGKPKRIHPLDGWLPSRERIRVGGTRLRPEMPRPLFTEDGVRYVNLYAPPEHPTKGGSIDHFVTFFNGFIPDDDERRWMWNWIAAKTQHPEWRMVSPVFIAQNVEGTGRGLYMQILALLFGERYVAPVPYSKISGGEGSRFRAEIAGKLLVFVNEAKARDDRGFYAGAAMNEALKDFCEPNHEIPVYIEGKNVNAYHTRLAVSVQIFSNNIGAVPAGDMSRRYAFIANGDQLSVAEVARLRKWMKNPANIGALYRHLMAFKIETDKAIFDPFMAPQFRMLDLAIDAAQTEIDTAWGNAREKLESASDLYCMEQIIHLTRHYLPARGSDVSGVIQRHTIANAFRIGTRNRKNWQTRWGPGEDNRRRVYAHNRAAAQRWSQAESNDIKAELDKAQKAVDAPGRAFNKALGIVSDEDG